MTTMVSKDTAVPATRRRRVSTYGVAGLALLILLFYGGGGWYFSNLLHADGLEPKAPSRDFGVTIATGDEDTVTLIGTDPTVAHAGRYGVWWEGGYGQIGEIVSTGGDGSVVRQFTLFEGVPPVGGGEVDLESFAYGDPKHAGLTATDVSYQSTVGDMSAWLVAPSDSTSTVWAIHVHGWRADRRETLRALPVFADAGVTSLVVSYRNDEGEPPDPTGRYRFGRSEWQDVQGAIEFAVANGAEQIVLVGYSTGAAAAMRTMEESAEAARVIGLVFDSPNVDFGRAVKIEAARRSIPGTPIPIPDSLTAMAMTIADLRWDIGWSEIDYVERTAEIDVPILVFQGSDDQTVPPAVARDMAAVNPGSFTLVETGAEHVQSWNEDPEAYEGAIRSYLARLLN